MVKLSANWRRLAAIGVIVVLGVLGMLLCGQNGDGPAPQSVPAEKDLPKLNVMVAAPLATVIEDIAADLRSTDAVDLQIFTDNTEALLMRLAHDSSAADLVLVEGMEAAKLLVGSKISGADAFVSIASDRLVLCVRAGEETKHPIAFLKNDVKPGRIVIADPDTTLMGLHSKQAMTRLGIWKDISFKIRHAASGEAVAQELVTKSADAAALYLSIVTQHAGLIPTMTFLTRAHTLRVSPGAGG